MTEEHPYERTAPLIPKILAAIEAAEQDARDASARGEEWSLAERPATVWGEDARDAEILAGGKPIIRLSEEYGGSLAADHITRWGPQAVLRHCAGHREILEECRKALEVGTWEETPWLAAFVIRKLAEDYGIGEIS